VLHRPIISADREEFAIVILPDGSGLMHLFMSECLIKLEELPVSIKAFNSVLFTLIATMDLQRQAIPWIRMLVCQWTQQYSIHKY